ncbi:hypothetical protein KAR52_03165 [Candidatus Pacearchaeota archaeon]|nr:hypothetical protein [Candidatus Pacearchaeota archaeon]
MNTKNILVSFLTVMCVLLLVSTVSAVAPELEISSNPLAEITSVTINGIEVDMTEGQPNISVIAGEIITVKVYFKGMSPESDVTLEAEIEGDKIDVSAITESFDVKAGSMYKKVLTLKVPSELKDKVDGTVTLNLEFDGDVKTELDKLITLNVQRPTYDVDFKSIIMSDSVEAGKSLSVEVVLQNTGYNDLDDAYVTLTLPALDISKTVYLGDMLALEIEDNDDTLREIVSLNIPYNAEAGIYTLEVELTSDDLTASEAKEIVINNDLSTPVIQSGNDLIIVNPTDSVKVYRIVAETPASVSESIVVVPASSSKTVTVSANAREYDFNVSVLSGENLVATVNFVGTENTTFTSPIVILTVVLAIVFLVLLVVLIVLIGKKPEKSEEFGESYY